MVFLVDQQELPTVACSPCISSSPGFSETLQGHCLKKYHVNGSLLPAAVIALYCTYICYSALSSEPHNYECNGLHNHVKAVSIGTLVMGMLTTLLSIVYSAVQAGSSTTFLSPPSSPRAGSGKPLLLKDDIESVHDNDDDHKGLSKGKKDGPVMYVYSFFHLIFALASMYLAMLLTGWGNASGGADVIDVGWPSVWVRFAHCCSLLSFTSGH